MLCFVDARSSLNPNEAQLLGGLRKPCASHGTHNAQVRRQAALNTEGFGRHETGTYMI